jgi:hypothetical protein
LNPANNSWTDTDFLIVPDPLPPEIGTTPGGSWYQLMQGSTLTINIPVVADGDVGIYDFVYYEILNSNPPPLILMDCIIVRVGDGENWYTVFNWGDNSPDANTNANYQNLTLPVTPPNPEEMDERTVSANDLYNTTGIAIDIDAIVPPGIYPYIQFYAPPDGNDGQAEIDAIEILP